MSGFYRGLVCNLCYMLAVMLILACLIVVYKFCIVCDILIL